MDSPEQILSLDDLSTTEKVVLSIANGLADRDSGCFANNEYFAQILNLSRGRVSKIISELVKKGYMQTDFSYHSEVRKIEKRSIKICLDCSQKQPEVIAENDHGTGQKRPYPLVENDQDIIYRYNISSCREFCGTPKTAAKIPDERTADKLTNRSKPEFAADSEAYLLARYLERNILQNNSKFPQSETQRQRWAKDIDLMLRLDKLDPDDIAEVIAWCQQDSFWRSNILSGKKLRQKYQELRMKM